MPVAASLRAAVPQMKARLFRVRVQSLSSESGDSSPLLALFGVRGFTAAFGRSAALESGQGPQTGNKPPHSKTTESPDLAPGFYLVRNFWTSVTSRTWRLPGSKVRIRT